MLLYILLNTAFEKSICHSYDEEYMNEEHFTNNIHAYSGLHSHEQILLTPSQSLFLFGPVSNCSSRR